MCVTDKWACSCLILTLSNHLNRNQNAIFLALIIMSDVQESAEKGAGLTYFWGKRAFLTFLGTGGQGLMHAIPL